MTSCLAGLCKPLLWTQFARTPRAEPRQSPGMSNAEFIHAGDGMDELGVSGSGRSVRAGAGPAGAARLARSHRQLLQPAYEQALVVFQVLARQREVRRAVEERAQRDLALHAGQCRSDADVAADAEGEVPVVLTAEVQPVRVGEDARVAVGRAPDGEDLL